MAAPSDLAGTWLDRPVQWEALAAVLRRSRRFGLDTEFYGSDGFDVAKVSCVGRAVVHVWSIAVRTKRPTARGFHRCRSWVLPGEALEHPALKAVLEDPTVGKDVHGAVDWHALANHGVRLRGGRNTLGLIRWTHPHLVNQPGRFRLKALMPGLLGRPPVCTFKDVVRDVRTVEVRKPKKVRTSGCSCGVEGCRKRKSEGALRHDKWKREETVEVITEKEEEFEWALEHIVPGHPKHPLLLDYALEDAVAALQIGELADAATDPAPFPYGGARPGFSQELEDAVVHMEAVGIHVDVPWCLETIEKWRAEEEKELAWLHRWYVKNAPEYGPHRRESTPGWKNGVDALWSSGPKKIRLLDALGVPRSPIWKKGRVKDGKVKLDATALEWIARNYPAVKSLVDHLLRLQRIRSGLKYVGKMATSGGVIHPICGPAGDDDERAGAVTGRLGVKGQLESQQLPSKEELDPLQVRRGIVA